MRYRVLMIALGVGLVAGWVRPSQVPCPVRGAWALDSVTVDGTVEPLGQWRQIKVLTATRYAWVGQEPGPRVLRSAADSLVAFRKSAFGGGPYRVTASSFIERIEYHNQPQYIGRQIIFSCRVVGDRWYHAGDLPVPDETGIRWYRLAEVWRRID
jgi:hypothetical protein